MWIPQPLLSTPAAGVDARKGWKVMWLWRRPSTRPRGRIGPKFQTRPCPTVRVKGSRRSGPPLLPSPLPLGGEVVSLPPRSPTTHAGPHAHLLQHLVQGLRPR